ncbi:MAG: hypothetical protein HFJ58_05350 [Clostridia bacterium]|nr:hypothetical protein [Clostridia bacterium]
MLVNLSLNDNTQKNILKHLETTSKLLSKVGTELSGTQKESKIYAMPDLGIAQNGTRMLGGFYTGACYTWDSDVPFVPVDATVNVCGTTVYKLKQRITVQEFENRLNNVMDNRETYLRYVNTRLPKHIIASIDLDREDKFKWNYNVGNHFVILAEQNDENGELPVGQYMIVHASAIELKKDNLKYGLYPVEGNWYYDDIKTIYAEKENRYLRYIAGDKAVQFWELANMLQTINKDRNRYFCKSVLKELAGEEIINLSHYGMPTNNSVCIGCQWEQENFTLLTAPGNDIYLVHPDLTEKNTIDINNRKITLTPHGCGVMLKNNSDKIEYLDDGILIGNKNFKKGESINIGNDVLVRTKGMDSVSVKQHIETILKKCPGTIYGQMHQLFARTKYGDFDYTRRTIEPEEL